MDLLAAEITARVDKDPGEVYKELAEQLGTPWYTRIDEPATPDEKAAMASLSPEAITAKEIAGEPIIGKLTNAPGNGAPIGGLKVVAMNGWFAVRPSGTESIYKIYAESFKDENHLNAIVKDARQIVANALTGAAKGA
jgi:phosphoglucomutase